jgi:hypothetical protein
MDSAAKRIYGNFAASIGREFFPREDTVTQLLTTFRTYLKIVPGVDQL